MSRAIFSCSEWPENNLRLAKQRKLPALSRSHGTKRALFANWLNPSVKIRSGLFGKNFDDCREEGARLAEFCSSSASGSERIVLVVARQAIKVGYYHSMRCE